MSKSVTISIATNSVITASKLFGFFVGQVMKATCGKANPAQVNDLLRKKLAG